MGPTAPPPCVHFLRGFCRFGSRCRFRHDTAAESLPFHHRQTVEAATVEDYSAAAVSGAAAAASSPDSRPSFRVMSYNILADQYAQEHSHELYSAVPWAALDWSSRAAMIAKEVAHWSPDVICFQEVDHFPHLKSLLKHHGYKGIYTQRTGGRPDGLAMFWKRSRFTAEAMRPVEFAPLGLKDNVCQLTVLRAKDSSFAFLIANIHVLFNPKRGDIKLAQVRTMLEFAHSLIQARPSGPCPIVVCGDFNSAAGSPLYEFVVNGELELMTTDRRRLSGQVEVAGRTGWPSIRNNFLAALAQGATSEADALDAAIGALPAYNSMTDPHNSMREPRLLAAELERQSSGGTSSTGASSWSSASKVSGSAGKPMRRWAPDELEMAAGSTSGTARHPLQLQSAYSNVTGSEPLYTTVHDKYVGTVDYIFYSPSTMQSDDEQPSNSEAAVAVHLEPVRVLQPPPLRTLPSGLPSLTWPSDHLCLLADFAVEERPLNQATMQSS